MAAGCCACSQSADSKLARFAGRFAEGRTPAPLFQAGLIVEGVPATVGTWL